MISSGGRRKRGKNTRREEERKKGKQRSDEWRKSPAECRDLSAGTGKRNGVARKRVEPVRKVKGCGRCQAEGAEKEGRHIQTGEGPPAGRIKWRLRCGSRSRGKERAKQDEERGEGRVRSANGAAAVVIRTQMMLSIHGSGRFRLKTSGHPGRCSRTLAAVAAVQKADPTPHAADAARCRPAPRTPPGAAPSDAAAGGRPERR